MQKKNIEKEYAKNQVIYDGLSHKADVGAERKQLYKIRKAHESFLETVESDTLQSKRLIQKYQIEIAGLRKESAYIKVWR